MIIVALDKKLKKVAFETTFNHLIKYRFKSTERVARNIIDAFELLSVESLTEPELVSIRLELIKHLQSSEHPDLILNWLLSLFK